MVCALALPAMRLSVAVLPLLGAAMHRHPAMRNDLAGAQLGKPNILYFLLDDFGWGDAGWHWPDGANPNGLQTHHMTKYVKEEGLELDRHYAHHLCSPTRSAIQSGRNPLKVNALNLKMDVWNPADSVSGFAGVPTEMTCIAEKLRNAGYETHIYGKWDLGATSRDQLPEMRGYDHSLVYFGHGNDPWTLYGGQCSQKVELWEGSGPAQLSNLKLQRDPSTCSQEEQDGCTYQESIFFEKVKRAILTHKKPFFIFWSTHLVHGPYGVPSANMEEWKDKDFIQSNAMLLFYGMVNYMDNMFGEMMDLLKEQGKWDNTLVIVHSDNGAPITEDHAGNNYPLRGGKVSNWEGGVRVPAFVTGGWLPADRRGKRAEEFITAWDWYHTLCALVGADIEDPRAAAAHLPAISDSVNQLPMILGQGKQRESIYLGHSTQHDDGPEIAAVSAFITDRHKIIVGSAPLNVSTPPTGAPQEWRAMVAMSDFHGTCGNTPEDGCLYDIFQDVAENVNLARTQPLLWQKMYDGFKAFGDVFGEPFNPDRGVEHAEFCEKETSLFSNFIGPVLALPGQ